MNGFDKNMRERKEKLPFSTKAIKKGCIDEDDMVENAVVKIGVAASGVVKMDGGNEDLYPIADRGVMKEANTYIDKWITMFSGRMVVQSFISSHPGCGAGSAQGFSEKELINATKALSDEYDIRYVGHLEVSGEPEKLEKSDTLSWFTRNIDMPHEASFINVTVGGGINGKEKKHLTEEVNAKAFDVSADWVKYALDGGFDKNKAIQTIVFQFKLAYAIAEGVRNNRDPFKIFNAERLNAEDTAGNIRIVQEAIAIAKREIAEGSWKAVSHH